MTNSFVVGDSLSSKDRVELELNLVAQSAGRGNLLSQWLSATCLHPKLTLRNQLLFSFGTISALSLVIFAIAAASVFVLCGERVKSLSNLDLENQTLERIVKLSKVLAESVTSSLDHNYGFPAILVELTRDRFVGYPNHRDYEDDSLVPFLDMITGVNKYPISSKELIPLDWELFSSDEELHHGGIWNTSKSSNAGIASIRFQGSCNPNVLDRKRIGFLFNCTSANNEISTGGTISPTSTFLSIHRKVSDYATAILKPLFEASNDALRIGIFFANSGAGCVVLYPTVPINNSNTYISDGCDWLLLPNPLDSKRTIGTKEMINRCHPAGEVVETGFYNPLERPWCSQQALNPAQVHIFGPYVDAFTPDQTVLTFGKAVYDRITNEFIACTLLDIPIQAFAQELTKLKTSDPAEVLLIRWNDSSLVASSRWTSLNPWIKSESNTSDDTLITTVLKNRFMETYSDNLNYSSYDHVIMQNHSAFVLYPVPTPPADYDSDYTPDFAIVLRREASEVFADISSLNAEVDKRVSLMVRTILISVLTCFMFIILCITVVSRYLTKPLQWMNRVSRQIFETMGSNKGASCSDKIFEPIVIWPKRTEISSLVHDFQILIQEFSGSGIAKLHVHKDVELKNDFNLTSISELLYRKRLDSSEILLYRNGLVGKSDCTSKLRRIHVGPIYKPVDVSFAQTTNSNQELQKLEELKLFSSPLFWWILSSIALPLLLALLVIAVYVTFNISNEFPKLIESVKASIISFEKHSSAVLLKAKAKFASMVIASAARDIFVLSRISGWLFFGALHNSNVITKMVTAAEECKDNILCPFVLNRTNTPCDCEWQNGDEFFTILQCLNYTSDVRYLQNLYWFSSKQDAWPNGDINFTTFPNTSYSPETTLWWKDWRMVPGALNSSDENTLFGFLKKISSQSIVQIPLFNYKERSVAKGTYSYTSLDSNGLHSGYSGCGHAYPFPSRVMNDATAADLNPTLCPAGKFGYDPRCRPWYVNAKLHHDKKNDPLHVTPPYLFADGFNIGQTFVLPLEDAETYFGQVSVDFSIAPILKSMTQNDTTTRDGVFSAMISIGMFNSGSEIIVAPNFDLKTALKSDEKFALEQFVLPHDTCESANEQSCQNLLEFKEAMQDMRAGKSSSTSFNRTNESGERDSVFWTFAPIEVQSFRQESNSDLSSGVTKFHTAIFSVGLGLPITGLHRTLSSVTKEMERFWLIGTIVLASFISIIICSFTFLCTKIASSIVHRFFDLRKLIKHIKKESSGGDSFDIQGGSKDLTTVLDTLRRLRTALLVGNTALYSGDLKTAYETTKNALELFSRLDNKKAIGISNNNLGNTMLSMYRELKTAETSNLYGLSLLDIISLGESYFKCAINQGEAALAEINNDEGWSTNYLVFMQQLSNRYFNRAIFLFTVKADHPEPENAEKQATLDLFTAKDMDREVVDNGDHQGFKGNSDVYFDLLLRRIKGMHELISLGYEDFWDVEELIEDAKRELQMGLKAPRHTLFNDIEPVGQMQRLDTVLIQNYLLRKENEKAALIGIRMFVEDDFLIAEAAFWAIKGIINYFTQIENNETLSVSHTDVLSQLTNYSHKVQEIMDLRTRAEANSDNLFITHHYEACLENF